MDANQSATNPIWNKPYLAKYESYFKYTFGKDVETERFMRVFAIMQGLAYLLLVSALVVIIASGIWNLIQLEFGWALFSLFLGLFWYGMLRGMGKQMFAEYDKMYKDDLQTQEFDKIWFAMTPQEQDVYLKDKIADLAKERKAEIKTQMESLQKELDDLDRE